MNEDITSLHHIMRNDPEASDNLATISANLPEVTSTLHNLYNTIATLSSK